MCDLDAAKVSVIVPVFNAEQYLVKCLDSIVAQTLSNIEIILVNDGSTDKSGEICNVYAYRDPRIEVTHKQNGGLASARNAGLAVATGEYIGFVDSDDWIEPCMYERMYTMAINGDCDIVWTNAYRNESEKLAAHMTGGIYDRPEIERHIFPRLLAVCNERARKEGVLRWSNCLRIYRHRLIREHQIRFDDRFRRCQDLPFTFECTIHSGRYCYLDQEYLYHNRVNIESLSRGYTFDMWGLIKPLVLYLREVTRKYSDFDFSQQMDFRVFLSAIDCVENESKLTNKNPSSKRRKIIRDIMKDSLIREVLPELDVSRMKPRTSAYYWSFRLQLPVVAYGIALWRHRRKRDSHRRGRLGSEVVTEKVAPS